MKEKDEEDEEEGGEEANAVIAGVDLGFPWATTSLDFTQDTFMPAVHRVPQLQQCWDSMVDAMNLRCQPEKGFGDSKNSNPIMLTAASTGSGKTHFLRDLCNIMIHDH